MHPKGLVRIQLFTTEFRYTRDKCVCHVGRGFDHTKVVSQTPKNLRELHDITCRKRTLAASVQARACLVPPGGLAQVVEQQAFSRMDCTAFVCGLCVNTASVTLGFESSILHSVNWPIIQKLSGERLLREQKDAGSTPAFVGRISPSKFSEL